MSAEELDPEKYHKINLMEPKTRKITAAITLFLVFIAFPLLFLGYYKVAVNRPSQTRDELTVVIESGEGVSSIAAKLYVEKAINSEFLFKLFLVVNRMQDKIQAGTYVIPAGTTTAELAELLQHGTNDKMITFLEGWRAEEYSKAASDTYDKIDYTEFLNLAKDMEGYLFPDTYEFVNDVTEQEMLDTLRDNFNVKAKGGLTEEALEKVGLTENEAIIFASIVEREVHTEEDRPIVAGILIKRWNEGMQLDADATTQYAIAARRYGCDTEENGQVQEICPDEEHIPDVDWWPDNLTQEELDYESPYNTRAVVGLPPAPIANPSLSAINAVLQPAETNYYYYLTDGDGITHYAETLDEHQQNIINFL